MYVYSPARARGKSALLPFALLPQATFALLEEGRPKQWDKRFTGGKTIDLKVPRLCADSGDIKVGRAGDLCRVRNGGTSFLVLGAQPLSRMESNRSFCRGHPLFALAAAPYHYGATSPSHKTVEPCKYRKPATSPFVRPPPPPDPDTLPQLGKTKIFIKHPHMLFDLEDQRIPGLFAVAVIIQSKARGFVCRRRYVRFLAVIGRVAAVARGFLARLRYRRTLDG